MSHELTPQSSPNQPPGALPPEAGYCRYCQAPLSAFYYFCLACGTPYKPFDSVITPDRPRQLSNEELVRLKAPQVATVFWTYLATIIGVGVFSYVLFREERPDLQLFLNELGVLAVTCVFGWRYRQLLAVQFKRFGFDHYQAWIAIALTPPLLGLNLLYHDWIMHLARNKHDMFQELRDIGISEGTMVLMFCVVPAILEEIAYRGLVQHWLQAALAPWRALVVASFLFAITHLSVISCPYLFLVGCLLGWAKQKTGSLYPSMLIHFVHNFVVIEYFPRA
ncbi:MAG: CPBP family intramembrane metalloprotease [Pirellulales bacterium]|nr:CPBP family intramembrane metalloprotease [Pirellulales bacterium]